MDSFSFFFKLRSTPIIKNTEIETQKFKSKLYEKERGRKLNRIYENRNLERRVSSSRLCKCFQNNKGETGTEKGRTRDVSECNISFNLTESASMRAALKMRMKIRAKYFWHQQKFVNRRRSRGKIRSEKKSRLPRKNDVGPNLHTFLPQ